MEEIKIPAMCRLCLTRKPFFYHFVDKKNDWAVLTKQLTGIDPLADTRYPQKLCVNCRKKLDAFSTFRKKCLKSQNQFRKEFLDNQPSLDMTVEMEVGLTQSPEAATNSKLDKYLDWSDDEKPEKMQIKEEGEEEFFELIAVVDDEDDKNAIKIEHVDIKPEQIQTEEILDPGRTEENDDKVSSTESEPDFFDFETKPEPKPKIPRRKGRGPRVRAVCHICGKSINKFYMEYHLNWHNDLRPFACPFEGCTASFNAPERLQGHRLLHSAPKFVCTVCGMKFFGSRYLKRHMLKHTKKWENVCPHCSKKCATKYNLKVHMRIHTGDRPYSCSKCKAAFAYNSLLKTHKAKCEEREDESEKEQ